jgi:cytidylate kinase
MDRKLGGVDPRPPGLQARVHPLAAMTTAAQESAATKGSRVAEGIYQVAIDGPAASGKSSTARRVAVDLGIQYLDTGAMYRALTWEVLRHGQAPDHPAAVLERLARLELDWRGGRVWVGGEDPGEAIRSNEVSVRMGPLCAMPQVREWMVELQRRLGQRQSTVLDGRDIGTVVFPLARFKFYLVADLEERARRRQMELASRGQHHALAELMAELDRRDQSDASRSTGPLRQAEDAIRVDTTSLSQEGQAALIVGHVRQTLERELPCA